MEVFSTLSAMSTGGRVWSGLISGGTILQNMSTSCYGFGVVTSVAQLANELAEVCPMPVGKRCSVNWVPSKGDENYHTVYNQAQIVGQSANAYEPMEGVNFAVMAVQIPLAASGSVAVQVTSVMEYNWMAQTGLPNNSSQIASTGYSRIIEQLQRKDSSWFINTATKIGHLIGKTGTGYMVGGLPGAGTALLAGLAGY